MKIVIGIVAGIVVAAICTLAIEYLGHSLYPPPPGTDLTNPAQVARLMESMPAAALAIVLVAWFVGALAGAWTANDLAGRAFAGWIVALLVVAGGVATMIMIPHPLWMWAGGIGLPLIAGWLAQRFSKASAPGTP